MSCYRPVVAFAPNDGGAISFVEKKNHRQISIPCGKCIGCKSARAQAWCVRIMHEAKMHDCNSFLTLTYDDAHLPEDGGLNYAHFQTFARRLRKRGVRFRFFMCGEYGETTFRPHYHAILFGVDFSSDRVQCNSIYSRVPMFTSPTLSECWDYGLHSIGSVTPESARYVASYCVLGDAVSSFEARPRVCQATGEIYYIRPSFCQMSLKPGIGFSWFEKYGKDVLNWDNVVMNGTTCRVPRYYDRIMDERHAIRKEEIDFERVQKVDPGENTAERLSAREAVAKAKRSFYSNRKL